MKIGEAVRKKVKLEQVEMFPSSFHEHYKVVNHTYLIGNDGKSYWSKSDLTWSKDTRVSTLRG